MGKGKKKPTSNSIGYLAEVRRNEAIFGCVTQPVYQLYPKLRNVIALSNNSETFEQDVKDPDLRRRLQNRTEHPYHAEISMFQLGDNYMRAYRNRCPKVSVSSNYTAVWISEHSKLQRLIEHLSKKSHIFVDLEHHSWRSYRGITPLLQISDGDRVFLVDTLELFEEVKALNKIFVNPNIVKVFHACQNDIKWLEKDFSMYVVGLMDTQIMHRIIYSTNNIGYKDIVHQFFPDAGLEKAVRNTDFRRRPLHPEQEKYAILDVYFLPHVYYSLLSNLNGSQLSLVVRECQKLSLLRYSYPSLFSTKINDSESMRMLKRARDIAARKEDVNPEVLCSVSSLEKLVMKKEVPLGITTAPLLNPRFLMYREAISVALKGNDPSPVFETVYRDLGIPFPYRPLMFCFNCEATTHVKRNCPEPKSVGKEKKKLHYLKHPEKKQAECRRRNANAKKTPEGRQKRNIRNKRRRQKKLIASIINAS